MGQRIYCSELAASQQASLVGTAMEVQAWLLIEYPRPWRARALEDNELAKAARELLLQLPDEVARLNGQKLRVQFIKQASSADVVRPRIFLVVDGRVIAGVLPSYAAIADLQASDLCAHELPEGSEHADPLYLVCTNGQRDLCCARFGLPLYETLRMEYPRQVWQTTHVGGHRYAPNLVCLPSGLVYGFVQPQEGLGILALDRDGAMSLAHLRGRAQFAEAAQAAEYFARRELNDLTSACRILSNSTTDPSREGGDSHRIALALGNANGEVEVVSERLDEAVLASCGAEPKAVAEYRLVSVSF